MSKKLCRAAGCEVLTTAYGAFCSTHKARQRRHGAPDQRGVTKAELKLYLKRVGQRIAGNEGLTIWGLLDDRWLSLAANTESLGRTTKLGAVRRAANEISNVGANVGPRTIVETVLAIYLMREDEPYRFKSDKAFDTQLVRRVRGLTERNATFSTSSSGRQTRVYSELSPKVTGVIAEWIKASLGQAGVWLAKQELKQKENDQKRRQRLEEALNEVAF